MKKSMIVIAIFLSTFKSYAEEVKKETTKESTNEAMSNEAQTSTKSLDSSEADLGTHKNFELSVGYANSSLDQDGDKIGASGVSFSGGKIFSLGQNLSTTSSLEGSVMSLDKSDLGLSNGSANKYEVGLSQRLSYDILASGVVVRPFIEAGLSRGRMDIESSEDFGFTNVRYELDVDYNKARAALGVQLSFSNGVTPFLKYGVSKMKFDKSAKVTTRAFGQTRTKDTSVSNRDFDSSTFSAGLGYQF